MNRELFALVLQGMKRKKKDSLLFMLVLFLSVSFAVVTLSVTGSIGKTNEVYRQETYGTWYGAIPAGREADREFLRGQNWLDTLGTAYSYGTILTNSEDYGIGTADENYLDIGRIALHEGRLPETADEIAMEPDVLSILGYDYSVGQEITLTICIPAGEVAVQIERTYTLCGVLREYADLWTLTEEQQSRRLNSALITPEAAASLFVSAQERAQKTMQIAEEAGTPMQLLLEEPVPQYFFTVHKGMEAEMISQVNQYLGETRTEDADTRKVCLNAAVSQESPETGYHYFYVGLILIVTLLTIICISVIQLQKQVRQIALFRSIGITRRQLRRMLFYETLCLCIPALILGIAGGALGIWMLLKLLLYSGSVPVQVDIPFAILLPLLLLWIIGVLLSRLAIFEIGLHVPLTGRLYMESHKMRRNRRLRNALVMLLSALFCTAVVFTVLESLYPLQQIAYWSSAPSYMIYSETGVEDRAPHMITGEQLEQTAKIPGVTEISALGEMHADLTFEGIENSPLAAAVIRSAALNDDSSFEPEGLAISLYAIPEENWPDYFDVENTDIDLNAFRNGEQVIMSFPVDLDGDYSFFGMAEQEDGSHISELMHFPETGVDAGDTVTLAFYGKKARKLGEYSAKIGAVCTRFFHDSFVITATQNPYTILCSKQFMENLLVKLDPGNLCGKYMTGEPFGYTQMNVYTDLNAGYLSTDAVMAERCARANFIMASSREKYVAEIQKELQTLLLVLAGGGCIVLVVLLLLGNVLTMETAREQRRYGILRILGMSRRQMKRQLICIAMLRGILSVISGWLLFGGYVFFNALRQYLQSVGQPPEYRLSMGEAVISQVTGYRLGGGSIWTILALSCAGLIVLLLVSRLAKRNLLCKDGMEQLRQED